MEPFLHWLVEKVGGAVATKAGGTLYEIATRWARMLGAQAEQREAAREGTAALAEAMAVIDALLDENAVLKAEHAEAMRELRAFRSYVHDLERRCGIVGDGEGEIRQSGS
ncbi:MAG: hypothetical protein AAFP17_06340 [Pseudomonadota bacterium]